MKYASFLLAATLAFAGLSTVHAQAPSSTQRILAAPPKSVSPQMQNIRVKLEIIGADGQPTQFEVLTSSGTVTFDNVADAEKINGKEYHTIMKFDAAMAYQNGSYIITYAYSQQKPYAAGETVQYRELGANGSAVIKLGEKFQLIKDPRQTVSLSLERAESATAPSE